MQTDCQQLAEVFGGRSRCDSEYMRPLCVRIGRLLLRLLQWGFRPITDIDDLVVWDRRSLNSGADHAANATLDSAVDWQRLDQDEFEVAKRLQPNWRVCVDGALRGNGCASAGMVVVAYFSDGTCTIVYRAGLLLGQLSS